MIATAVTTAPREGPPLLGRCLHSLRAAGFDRPLVFAEPNSLVLFVEAAGRHNMAKFLDCGNSAEADRLGRIAIGDVEIIQRPERLGAWQNWLYALKETLERRPDADAVLIVQDDVVFCRNLAAFLDRDMWPSPRCGMVQVCSSMRYRALPRGLVQVPKANARHALAGAWANLFPRHVAYQVVAHGLVKGWDGSPRKKIADPVAKQSIDVFCGRTVAALGHEVWLYNPSLGQHQADHSTLGHGPSDVGNLRSLKFPGSDADCFSLFKPPASRWNLPSCTVRTRYRSGWQRLAVVIPIAGPCDDLMESCLQHLARYAAVPLLVIVVDNGTPLQVGQAVERIAAEHRLPLELIRNQSNLGFTAAVNQGLEAARRLLPFSDCLLLNSDCRVGPNCIPLLMHALGTHPAAAAVGPLSLDNGHQSLKDAKRRKQAGLETPSSDHWPLTTDHCSTVWRLPNNTVSEEPMLAFFCALLRRAALDELGGLDESPELASGLCVDDLWCNRARWAGWALLLHHGAFADHTHSETFRRLRIDRDALHREAVREMRRSE